MKIALRIIVLPDIEVTLANAESFAGFFFHKF